MSAGVLFWFLMIMALISLLGGVFGIFGLTVLHGIVGTSIFLWILLALLGWKVYGPALHQ